MDVVVEDENNERDSDNKDQRNTPLQSRDPFWIRQRAIHSTSDSVVATPGVICFKIAPKAFDAPPDTLEATPDHLVVDCNLGDRCADHHHHTTVTILSASLRVGVKTLPTAT